MTLILLRLRHHCLARTEVLSGLPVYLLVKLFLLKRARNTSALLVFYQTWVSESSCCSYFKCA